ncbi:MAG: hypothetical protein V4584_07325 [Verrucomicrobiota bacterium]
MIERLPPEPIRNRRRKHRLGAFQLLNDIPWNLNLPTITRPLSNSHQLVTRLAGQTHTCSLPEIRFGVLVLEWLVLYFFCRKRWFLRV